VTVSRQKRIVVVGAGISGLATAFHLQEALPAVEVLVLESQPRVGGAVWTERRNGYQFELGADSFQGNQASTLRLCHRLGIQGELIEPSPESQFRFLWHENRMHVLPSSLGGLLTSRLVSFGGAYRLLTERFRRGRAETGDESIYQFVQSRVGRGLAETFADAVTTGLYAGDAKLLSFRSCFPRLAAAASEHGSISRGLPRVHKAERERARQAAGPEPHNNPVSVSFEKGMGRLVETLQERLRTPPRLGAGVRQVRRTDGSEQRWEVIADGSEPLLADAVILACPALRQAGMLADLDPDLAEALLSVPYASVVVLGLGYRREHVPGIVESYGFVVPQRFRRDLLGVQFCSTIYRDRAPAGHVLLRVIAGGWHRREMASWDDDILVAVVRRELRVLLGISKPPQFLSLARWPKTVPQYTIGHAQRVEKIEGLAGTHPGLFVTGSGFHGLSINACTEQAERVAQKVQAYLTNR
jgi:protoporphyrinogen/coproporphyrinogen III oxidase